MGRTRPLAWPAVCSALLVLSVLLAREPEIAPPTLSEVVDTTVAPAAAPEDDVRQLSRQRLAQHLAQVWRVELAQARQIVEHAHNHAAVYGLSPFLLLAVMAQESSFRVDAVSSVGAVGLMQVMPRWHDQRRLTLGLEAPLTDPTTNIAVGAHILDEYLRHARGNLNKALEKYSGGATGYALRVLRYQREFERIASEQRAS